MLNKCLAMASALLFAGFANAQEVNEAGLPANSDMQSEFFFQAPAGHSDLSLRLGYKMLTARADGSTTDEKRNGLYKTGVTYEYGLSDMWALEGVLHFASLETDGNPKLTGSGLMNPEVVLKGTSMMDWGRLRYGAVLGLGIEKRKFALANPSRDGNMATGGSSLMPYVGADMNMGGGILGGRLAYEYLMDRKVDFGGTEDATYKDGHELLVSAFYEHFFADMLIGGSINYKSAGKEKIEVPGGLGGEVDSHNTTGISVYSRIPMGTWALVPRLDYDFSRTHAEKYDDMNLSVAARFGF